MTRHRHQFRMWMGLPIPFIFGAAFVIGGVVLLGNWIFGWPELQGLR